MLSRLTCQSKRRHSLRRLILRRLVTIAFMLIGFMAIVFVIACIAPGDPARPAVGPDASTELVEVIRLDRGLEKPLIVRFGYYIGNLATGDLGTSLLTRRLVLDDIARFFPVTLEMGLVSIGLAVILGVPLGMLGAVYHNKLPDQTIRPLAISGVALPIFWLGLMLMLQGYLSLGLDLFPLGGRFGIMTPRPEVITGLITIDALLAGRPDIAAEALWHMVLPAIALSFSALASIIRVTRAEMLETLDKDYILNARARHRVLPHRRSLCAQKRDPADAHDDRPTSWPDAGRHGSGRRRLRLSRAWSRCDQCGGLVRL
nr:ABC transporter permease [uncultured Roseobacter sp.]